MCGNRTASSSQSLTLSSIISSSGINDETEETNANSQTQVRCSSTPDIDVVSEGSQGGDAKMTNEKESLEVTRNKEERKIEEDSPEKGLVSLADLIGRNVITGNYRLTDLLRTKAVEGVPSRQVCPFYGINNNFYLKNIRTSTSVFDNLNRSDSHQANNTFSIFAVDTVGGAMQPMVKVPCSLVESSSSSSLAHSQMLKIASTDLDDDKTGDNTGESSSNSSEELQTSNFKRKHSEESIPVPNGCFKLKCSNSQNDSSDL